MSCTSIKPAFKIITEVGLKRYSEIKDINSIKIGCVTSGRGGGVYGVKLGILLSNFTVSPCILIQ